MGCQTGNLPQAAVLFDSSYGNTKKLLNPEIEELFGDPYGNRTHVTAVKGPCLNRLTNGPYKIQSFAKTSDFHHPLLRTTVPLILAKL